MLKHTPNNQDLIGGALLVVTGASLSIYCVTHYDLGHVNHMGPGMYPTAIGVLLAILGLSIAVMAFLSKNRGKIPPVELRPLIFSFGSIAAFTVLLVPFGLVPAVCALTIISALGDTKLGPVGIVVLAVVLSITSVVIFPIGLALPIRIWNWPF